MLRELAPVPTGELPLAALRDHLRLGTGFADDALQDGILEAVLRAALTVIEGRTGRVLIARGFELRTPSGGRIALPHSGAVLVSVEVGDAHGARTDATAGASLAGGVVEGVPAVPRGGAAVIGFRAGFGAWEAVPADLRQAVLMLAASYYEDRAAASEAAFPAVVGALVAPWRVLRLGPVR